MIRHRGVPGMTSSHPYGESMGDAWIKTTGLCRYYERGASEVRALDRVDCEISRGEFVAVVGASGSGKATRPTLVAGLAPRRAAGLSWRAKRSPPFRGAGLPGFAQTGSA